MNTNRYAASITKDELDSFLTKIEEEMKAMFKRSQTYNEQGKGDAESPGRSVDSVV